MTPRIKDKTLENVSTLQSQTGTLRNTAGRSVWTRSLDYEYMLVYKFKLFPMWEEISDQMEKPGNNRSFPIIENLLRWFTWSHSLPKLTRGAELEITLWRTNLVTKPDGSLQQQQCLSHQDKPECCDMKLQPGKNINIWFMFLNLIL